MHVLKNLASQAVSLSLIIALAGCQASVFAAEPFTTEEGSIGQAHFETLDWEVGLGLGYAFVQNSPVITQNTRNPLSDFGFPDSLFVVETTGKVHNSYALQGYFYRKVTSFLSFGLEATYQFEHHVDTVVTSHPLIYIEPTAIRCHEDMISGIPTVKIGRWMGGFKPYLTAGAGWASIHRSLDTEYAGFFVTSADRRDDYVMTSLGGGMDFKAGESGSIGIVARYNKIYASGPDLNLLVPSMHFSYLF